MKLIATALVAALSLVAGCATDNDGEGGGFSAGLRPSKPSADDINNINLVTTPHGADLLNPKIGERADNFSSDNGDLVAETIQSPVKFGDVALGDSIDVLVDRFDPTHLHVVDGTGGLICHIWLSEGRVQWTDCGGITR